MKKKELQELKTKTKKELEQLIRQVQKDLVKLKMEKEAGKLKDVHLVTKKRFSKVKNNFKRNGVK